MQDENPNMWENRPDSAPPAVSEPARGVSRKWLILALGSLAQTASCTFLYGIPFLVPAMLAGGEFTLAQAGGIVAAPSVGLLGTLILWGAAADAYGERRVIAFGLTVSGALAALAAFGGFGLGGLFAVLLAAGAFAGSVNAASGRVVMGWFPAEQRGLAMGVRQTAQPLGVGLAALALPPVAQAAGFPGALAVPACFMLVGAGLVAWLVVDPPRPAAAAAGTAAPTSPYRDAVLWRVHLASALLVVPQFAVGAFAPVYLVAVHHWSPLQAGWFLAGVQGLGAAARLAAGHWSDRVRSRVRPIRQLAVASTAAMLLLVLGDASVPWLAVVALVLAAVISVSDNGLGFTASAELAGTAWAGRAMGVQNTMQNVAASATPPVLALVIGSSGYALAFALAAVFPALAIGTVPVRQAGRRGVSAPAADPRGR